MKVQPKYFLLTIVVVVSMPYLVHFLLLRASETERIRSFGKYNNEQIVALAESICSRLRLGGERLSYTTDRVTKWEVDGNRRTFWQVHCEDVDGNGVANLEWDAQTGEISAISRLSQLDVQNVQLVRNGREAERSAYDWMLEINIVRRNSPCRLMGPPHMTGPVWCVHYRTGDRMVRTVVDSRTGDLMILQSRRVGSQAAHRVSEFSHDGASFP